jgi:hypothetical protein
VLAVNERTLSAVVITTQIPLEFDLETASAFHSDGYLECKIDSIAELPDDVQLALRALDERYRRSKLEVDARLSRTEIDAILFVKSFVNQNPYSHPAREPLS